ncbi:hypothetical protein ACFLX1_02225 [Chloroflexota bacterium]
MNRNVLLHLLIVGALALISMIGFDLFLHAGVLAPLYASPSPFLLAPEEAFRRIPLGYLSFAILTVLIAWIMYKLRLQGWRRGLVFGLAFGALTWGSFVLGLLSISAASPTLLIGWFMGQTAELGIGGLVVGSGLATDRLRRLLFRVVIFFGVTVVLAIVLQNVQSFATH